ncbi:MAG: hypothetical protein U0354_05525 [Candidatus Sericytochromatia bacterium]
MSKKSFAMKVFLNFQKNRNPFIDIPDLFSFNRDKVFFADKEKTLK